MINLLALVLLGITFSFANPVEKMADLQKKIDANLSDFCAKGSESACNIKKEMENPGSSKTAPKKMTAEEEAYLQEGITKMKACGQDMACIKKLGAENTKKTIEKHSPGCKAGKQDDCFLIEHMKLMDEMQQVF